MKKVLVTLVLVMTLGVSVSFAQAAPVDSGSGKASTI